MPGPTNGDSRVTPSRSGMPACAFSANSRYRATEPSSTASARHGVAKLPPTTTLGVPTSAPSATASCRSGMRRIAALHQSLNAKPPSVHDRRGDPEEVVAFARCPRLEAGLRQTEDLLAVSHRPGVPDDGHAPARVRGEVRAVRLEGDDDATGRGGELAA